MLNFVRYIINLDHQVSNYIEHTVKNSLILSKFFIIFKEITNFIGIPLVLIILFGSLALNTAIKIAALWLAVLLINEYVIKNLIRRKRPYHHDGKWAGSEKVKSFSFPSSHAYVAGFLLTIWLALELPFKSVAVLILLLLPLSRVALNYHFIIDVLVGLTIGIITAIISLLI